MPKNYNIQYTLEIKHMGNYNALRKLTAEQKKRLESGKPVFFENGVRITKNKLTGEYEGIPQ